MATQRNEEIVFNCIEHSDIPDESGARIVDKCHHFLGKISKGRVYVYCVRCKMLILIKDKY